MHSVLDMAAEKSLNTLAIGYQESDFPTAVAAGTRRYAPEKGLTIVYDESYPVGSPDMQSFVTAMAKTRPDIIVLGAYLDDSVAFMKALKATGYAPKMLAISGAPAVDDFGIRLGSDTDGVIATTQWMRDGRIPMSFDFGYRYKQLYGHYPSYNAAGGYASGQITEAAARLAVLREVIDDPVQIRARMREKLSTMRFQSLLGNYRPDATGQQSGKEIYVIQWQWPHRSLIAPTEIARWELKFPFPAWEGRQ
jgi:branched-chain amino acid transport system substrate-binding protein